MTSRDICVGMSVADGFMPTTDVGMAPNVLIPFC